MRALVDMSEAQVEALDVLARQEGRSRASIIRAAIDDYLAVRRDRQVRDGFGLWGEHETDGMMFQEEVRREW